MLYCPASPICFKQSFLGTTVSYNRVFPVVPVPLDTIEYLLHMKDNPIGSRVNFIIPWPQNFVRYFCISMWYIKSTVQKFLYHTNIQTHNQQTTSWLLILYLFLFFLVDPCIIKSKTGLLFRHPSRFLEISSCFCWAIVNNTVEFLLIIRHILTYNTCYSCCTLQYWTSSSPHFVFHLI